LNGIKVYCVPHGCDPKSPPKAAVGFYLGERMRNNKHKSECLGEMVQGTPEFIVRFWEAKAYACERNGDYRNAQIYFQQAEGWKVGKE
jgi:hypothetical protein